MKSIIVLFLLFFSTKLLIGQTPQGFSSKIYDRFGTEYKISEISLDTAATEGNNFSPRNTVLCFSTGFFRVFFENGSGFDGGTPTEIARRNVICQLFTDLSNFIVPADPNTPVNIWIRNISAFTANPATSGTVGVASPFYVIPAYQPNMGAIADFETWKTINSGIDSYSAVLTPNTTFPLSQAMIPGTIFHGYMAFNFANPLFANQYHTDLTTLPGPGQIDLYSVALHEMLHVLGIASLIYFDGNSIVGIPPTYPQFYSRYDMFLKTSGGQNLISNGGSCLMYDYTFNPGIDPVQTMSPNPFTCGGILPSQLPPSETYNCPTNIVFSGTVNQAVYTPDCFELGSSLSHLEDQCHQPIAHPDNEYYVMSNASAAGISKRYLKEEEKQILCDLGYHVNGYYGNNLHPSNSFNYASGECNDVVAGSNDGVSLNNTFDYTVNVNTAVPYTISNVLNNDFNADHFECLELVYGAGSVSNQSGTTFDFLNPTQSGINVLRYIPVSATGKRGNVTYVYIYVIPTACQNSPCDLISNGNFESGTNCGQFYLDQPAPVIDCWENFSATPDFLRRNCVSQFDPGLTIPSPLTSPASDSWSTALNGNNGMIALRGNEGLQNFLSNPIQPGVAYQIGFFAKVTNNAGNAFLNVPDQIAIYGGNSIVAASGLSNAIPSGFVLLATITIPQNTNNQWNYVTAVFTSPGPLPLSKLLFVRDDANNSNLQFGETCYTFFDDVSIVPVSVLATINFSPLGALCQNQLIPDLMSYVSIPGGTFSGPGVSFNGSTYQFDPVAAGPGVHTIAYLYDGGSGCSQITTSTVSVSNQNMPNIVFSPPANLCTNTGLLDLNTLVSLQGGVFSGTGVSGNYFDPIVAGPGVHPITYVYTQVSTGCSQSVTQNVNVELCCPSAVSSLVIIQPGTYANLNWNNPLVTYYVQGDIVLNGSNTFVNANIVLNDNSSITVSSGASLSITGSSRLYSCNLMWDGIIVNQNGLLNIIGTTLARPVIEDAKVAVTSVNGADIRLQFCDLNRNHKGVVFTTFSGTHPGVVGPSVRIMTQTSLIPANNNQNAALDDPSLGIKTLYGVEIQGGGAITIGANTLLQSRWNLFENCKFGIFGYNVNATITCNRFNKINGPVPPVCNTYPNCQPIEGTSIYFRAKESRSIVIGTTPQFFNLFTDCRNGVEVFDYTNVTIRHNNLNVSSPGPLNSLGSRGVLVINHSAFLAANMNINISNNLVQNHLNSIKYVFTNMSVLNNTGLTINNNSINQNLGRLTKAISIESVQPAVTSSITGPNNWNIQNNSILAVQDGIILSNIQGANTFVGSNNITTTNGTARTGIRLSNCKAVVVKQNNITGTGYTIAQLNHRGIWASFSPSCFFQCNNVYNTGQSIVFEGSMLLSSTGFAGNLMHNAYRGFVLLNGGTIGPSGSPTQYSDNRWTGVFTNFKTYTDNTTNANAFSPLYTRLLPAYNPALIPGENGSSQGLAFRYFQGVGGGLLPFAGGQAFQCPIINNPGGGNPIFLLNSIAEGSIYFGVYEAQLSWNARQFLFEEIKTNPDLTNYPVLDSFAQANINSSYDKIYEFNLLVADSNVVSAFGINQTILTNSLSESNFVKLNSVILNLLEGSDLDSSDVFLIAEIALDCPVYGGVAVYQARSLYNVLNETSQDFEDNCFDSQLKSDVYFEKETESDFRIFPNPSNGILNIQLNTLMEWPVNIEIFDITGQIVFCKSINQNSELTFSLPEHLPKGTYYVSILHNTIPLNTQILILID